MLAKQAAVLPLENAEEYTAFAEQLWTELQPVGLVEGELVDQVIAGMWRRRRLGRMETGILTTQYFTILTEGERGLHREYNDVVSTRADHAEAETAMLGQAYIRGMHALSNLSRYETTVGRGLQRALQELERLQRARQGEQVRTTLASEETSEPASPDTTAEETEPRSELARVLFRKQEPG
jgi:hypothetical protein